VSVLVSTIAGTFTTAINLYDRIGEKRKQHKKDSGQDAKIKELNKHMEELEKEKTEHQRRADTLRDTLSNSGPAIQRQYDRDFRRLGTRFAEGDGEWLKPPLHLIAWLRTSRSHRSDSAPEPTDYATI
jgi:phosphoenolpyruvate carboxylase